MAETLNSNSNIKCKPEHYKGKNITAVMLLTAAENVVEAKRKLWQNELGAKTAAIRFAIENKQTLGDHYWQAEHNAYQVYLSAQRVYKAILEGEA